MIINHPVSRRVVLGGAAGVALATAAPRQAHAAGALTVVDTVSGPNFQAFWNTYLIPTIRAKTGVEVKYTVGSGPPLQLQMKSWRDGGAGFSLLFLKDLDLANMVAAGNKFEALYPARVKEIPNQRLVPKEYDEVDSGVPLHGDGLLFWRAQFGLIHNTKYVKNPPKTWKEWFDRRDEFKGHIGMVRTDAGSGGGRAIVYAFLAANGVDFTKPFADLQSSAVWKDGLSRFTEFSRSFAQPIASEPPVMFHQFQTEQVWMTSYAQDYSLWSAEQGQLPPTTRSTPLDVNIIGSSNAYLAVPAADTDEQKADAYKVIDLLLSDEVQLHMLETMYQYPGTDAWKKAPATVWDKIAPVDVAQGRGITMTNLEAITFIQRHGMDLHRYMTEPAREGRPAVLSAGARHLLTGGLFVAPLVLFLAAAFYYPLGYTLVQSLTPEQGSGWTLANYVAFLGSRDGLGVLALTLWLSFAATVLSILLCLPLALLLRRRFAGRGVLQFLMMLPITIPALVGALGLLILYDRTGWLNVVLIRLHVITEPLAIDYTISGLILFYVWMFFPFGGLVIMSGLGGIDPALEEAGAVAGASPLVVFRRVLLPLLRGSLWAGGVMIFLQCFGAFSVPLIAGGDHQPVGVRIYRVANVFLDWPLASAMAVVMGIIQAGLVMAYQSAGRRGAA